MQIVEKKQNLFNVSKEYMLVHCISADCKMGAGIAVEFARKGVQRWLYRNIQNIGVLSLVGTCVVSNATKWVGEANLITKVMYWHKPTYATLKASLLQLKAYTIENDVRKIAMPKIGCGLDRLVWSEVRKMLTEVFADTEVEILVCYL